MAPLEPWEKVLVNVETFSETLHGEIPCTACHMGQSDAADKEIAHEELIARPSENFDDVCYPCHEEVALEYNDSLHYTQAGYWDTIEARTGSTYHTGEMEEMFGNHCQGCHTTCGDCHVSQPASVGGGLIDGHVFNATPSLTRNCTACHGSRVGNEYLGKNEGVQADVHFRQGRMSCVDCHTGDHMHSSDDTCEECHDGMNHDLVDVTTRYDGAPEVACVDCHLEVVETPNENLMHEQHAGDLQCQICHSASYSSCDSCHVSVSLESGNPIYKTDGTYMTFFIGKNPLQNYHRPYEYALLRHIPVDMESYSFYGIDLENFAALPTWAYATPHNIQLNTPQTESCDACHGNADIFLTIDKVNEEEIEANLPVILDEVPDPSTQNADD